MTRPLLLASALAAATSAASPDALWYPAFATSYEAGRCTTAPDAAVLALAMGSASVPVGESSVVFADQESCCARWFAAQELCGCLGGCPGEPNDAAAVEEPVHYYPKFATAYEAGSCVPSTEEAPPEYYTVEGGFLHATLEGCCGRWFDRQADGRCLGETLSEEVLAQPTASVTSVVNGTSAVEEAVVEPLVMNEAVRFVHVAEETM